MFKDFIDLTILKDAQPGFFSQSVGVDLNKILVKFEGQGHKSKVKVTRLGNVILDQCYSFFRIWMAKYI